MESSHSLSHLVCNLLTRIEPVVVVAVCAQPAIVGKWGRQRN
jgi:hypothetical protein